MLYTQDFFAAMQQRGYNFISGVPCSFLDTLMHYAATECRFVMSANEGDAVATSSGAALAGVKSVVLMQNSGLTNAISPLTSLNHPFAIPILGFVSHRGAPEIQDEPQHQLMGAITPALLELMRIPYAVLSSHMPEALKQLAHADSCIEQKKPFFFIVKKGTFDKPTLSGASAPRVKNRECIPRHKDEQLPTRWETLQKIVSLTKGRAALLATTGKTGRELHDIADTPNHLYMVGSMGCVSSLALGVALNTHKPVIVLDGDGSLLMRLGNLATNAGYAPPHFFHLVLDNHAHSSTGGQFTLSHNADFVSLAAHAGYQHSYHAHSLAELVSIITNWYTNPVTTFCCLSISPQEQSQLGRPKLTPKQVGERFTSFIYD